MRIGDHDFIEGLCLKCGKRWVNVRMVDDSYIGESGYACSGTITSGEVPDYVRERAREDAAIAAAFSSLS